MTDWHNLYSSGWQNIITPEAFCHPAKFSRGLIERIYEHAIDEGWLSEGSTVVDPFGGVALGAWPALRLGINWIGVELERPFVDLSAGCECTGIGKVDWVRFHGRWNKARYLEDRHWCPGCLAEAKRTLPEKTSQLEMFADVPTASYRRNSGIIPTTEPHHYVGNLELFTKVARNGAMAIIIQGDSRELGEVLRGGLDGAISSPPFMDQMPGSSKANFEKRPDGTPFGAGAAMLQENYGSHPAQLGNMPEGELDAAISSPPYAECLSNPSTNIEHTGAGGPIHPRHYGSTEGQLAAMPEGELDAAISSPPYAESLGNVKSGIDWSKQADRESDHPHGYDGGGYGPTEGQLAAMPEGEFGGFDGAISSPPYEGSIDHAPGNKTWDTVGGIPGNIKQAAYGETDNNIGNTTGPTFWQASRVILQQLYQVLKPGGVAIFVTKRFVRNKQIVEFSQQWFNSANLSALSSFTGTRRGWWRIAAHKWP